MPVFFFFQAEDGIRDLTVTGVQTCALPISLRRELGDREKRLAPPMKAVLDAPAAPRELGSELPHDQFDARFERHPARDVATHPRVGRQRAWPREWYRWRSGERAPGASKPPY